MKARDVMVAPVVTVTPSQSARDVAILFARHRISAVPVVDEKGRVVGIVSEGDLMRRSETDTERRPSWWLSVFTSDDVLANEYIRAHARKVSDLMTKSVITAAPDTLLSKIATILERNAIKRVPIVSNGQLVGIVSRANLVQAMAAAKPGLIVPMSDTAIRERLLDHLKTQRWAHAGFVNITVFDGVVSLWGLVPSETEKRALRVAAEQATGVRAVEDNLLVTPSISRAA